MAAVAGDAQACEHAASEPDDSQDVSRTETDDSQMEPENFELKQRWCVGQHVVSTQFIGDTEFLVIDRGATGCTAWLAKVVGAMRLWGLAKPNVLDELIAEIKAHRGGRKKSLWIVGTDMRPMSENIDVEIRSHTLRVASRLKPLLVEAAPCHVAFLISELRRDQCARSATLASQGDAPRSDLASHTQATCDADMADSDDFLADIMHMQSTHKSEHVCWAKSVDSFVASFRNASDNTVQKGKFRVQALAKKLVPNWHAEVKFQRHRAVHFAATGETLPQQALESELETPPAKRFRQREDTQRRA